MKTFERTKKRGPSPEDRIKSWRGLDKDGKEIKTLSQLESGSDTKRARTIQRTMESRGGLTLERSSRVGSEISHSEGVVITYLEFAADNLVITRFAEEGNCTKFFPDLQGAAFDEWAMFKFSDEGLPLPEKPNYATVEDLGDGTPSGFIYSQQLLQNIDDEYPLGHYVFSVEYSLSPSGYMYIVTNDNSNKVADTFYPGRAVNKRYVCFWLNANVTGYTYNVIVVSSNEKQSFFPRQVNSVGWQHSCIDLEGLQTRETKTEVDLSDVTQILLSHENRFLGAQPTIKVQVSQIYFSDINHRFPYLPALRSPKGMLEISRDSSNRCSYAPLEVFNDLACTRFFPDFENVVSPFSFFTDTEIALLGHNAGNPGLGEITALGIGPSATITSEEFSATTTGDTIFGFNVFRAVYTLIREDGSVRFPNAYSFTANPTSMDATAKFVCFFMKVSVDNSKIEIDLSSDIVTRSAFTFFTVGTDWKNYCFPMEFFNTVFPFGDPNLAAVNSVGITHRHTGDADLGPVTMEYGLIYFADTARPYPILPALVDPGLAAPSNGTCVY